MATLINGNGNPRIYAAQDADLIATLAGDITGIAQIGNMFAATAVDANTISVADGVIVTKEGRRIQLDAGSTDMFVIPTGTTGVTNYYIIGYKLTTQSDDSQVAETFVQLMSSSSETIPEDTFRAGATDVYVSLYRVQQNGVNLGTITGLLPELTNISELKSGLTVIGDTIIQSGSQTNVANNSNVAIVEMPTIPKGIYIVTGWLNFQSTNTTGSRCGKFASANYNGKEAEVAPNTGGYTQMIISDIVTFNEDTSTFCLQCRQTSGSLMNVSGKIKLIRIK